MKLSRFINSMPNVSFKVTNLNYPSSSFKITGKRVTPKLHFEETNKFSPRNDIKAFPNQTLHSEAPFIQGTVYPKIKTIDLNIPFTMNSFKTVLTDTSLLQAWKHKYSVTVKTSNGGSYNLDISGESAIYTSVTTPAKNGNYTNWEKTYSFAFNVDPNGTLYFASDYPDMGEAAAFNTKNITLTQMSISYYDSTITDNYLKATSSKVEYALCNKQIDLLQKYSLSGIVQNSLCTVCYSSGGAGKVIVINHKGEIAITDSPMGEKVSFSVVNDRIFMYLYDSSTYCNKIWYIDGDNTTAWTEVTLPLYYKDGSGLFTKLHNPATGDFIEGTDSNIIYIYPASSYTATLHDTDGGAQVSKGMYSTNGGKSWTSFTAPVKYGYIYKYNNIYIISSTASSSCMLYYCPYFFFPTSDTVALTSVTFNSVYHELCTLQGYLCCFPDTTSTANSKYYYSSDGKTWTSKSITSGKWGVKIYDNTKVILGYATGSGPLAENYQTYKFLVITNPTSGASSSSGSETSNPSHPKWYTNTRATITDRGYNVKIAQWSSKTYISIDGKSFVQASGISAPSGITRVHGSCFLCYSSKTLYRSTNGTEYSKVQSFDQNIRAINIVNGLIIIQIGTSSSTCSNKLYVSYDNAATFIEILLPKNIYFNTAIRATNHFVLAGTYYIEGVQERNLVSFNYFSHPTISETLQNWEEQL